MEKRVAKCNKLLKRIRQGDEKALDNLFEEFGPLFLHIAKHYLVNKNTAEDLLSELFLDIVKSSANTFDDQKNGLNWIYTIIKRKAYKFNENTYVEVNIDNKNIAECIDDEYVEIKDALSKLTDEENEIIYLKFWEGYTVREIAKILDNPKSNVQYIIKRAIKKLKNQLENRNENEK